MENAKSVILVSLDGTDFLYVDGDLRVSGYEVLKYRGDIIGALVGCAASHLKAPCASGKDYTQENSPPATLHGLLTVLSAGIPDLRIADRGPMRQFCETLRKAMSEAPKGDMKSTDGDANEACEVATAMEPPVSAPVTVIVTVLSAIDSRVLSEHVFVGQNAAKLTHVVVESGVAGFLVDQRQKLIKEAVGDGR